MKGNTSEWILRAETATMRLLASETDPRKRKILSHLLNLGYLEQDKTKIYDSLTEIGLPHPTVHRFDLTKLKTAFAASQGCFVLFYKKEKKRYFRLKTEDTREFDYFRQFTSGKWGSITHLKMEELFQESSFFCRLVPKEQKAKRPYHPLLQESSDFIHFLRQHELDQYSEIHLVEKKEIRYTGGIIASYRDDHPFCIVELVAGDGSKLFHGEATPFQARTNDCGILQCSVITVPSLEERTIMSQAVKMIGGPRHPFPGYYEFDVQGERILFRNYQPSTSAYADLTPKREDLNGLHTRT